MLQNEYFNCKNRRRYSRERASLSLEKMNRLFNPLLTRWPHRAGAAAARAALRPGAGDREQGLAPGLHGAAAFLEKLERVTNESVLHRS